MAEKSIQTNPKELVEATPEEVEKLEEKAEEKEKKSDESEKLPIPVRRERKSREEMEEERRQEALEHWIPKTELGKLVKHGKIKDIDEILDKHKKIVEPEIVDILVKPQTDLLSIGQAKGKFGGGKRRAWRQTQKKTQEGNVTTFASMAVVGDKKGHVGIGMGKSKETLPAREKALRQAKLNLIRVKRGFETREEPGSKPHTVPYVAEGKCGSVRLRLIPAPRGTGLVIGDECKKILRLAGIEDVYSATKGKTRTVFNFARACIDALKNLDKVKE